MGTVVFIVDDDTDDREFFCEALHEIDENITCICAGSGNEAITLLNQPGTVLPDYIFMDLNMPRLSGKQCLTLIKKMERLSDIPVIIFSTTRQFHEAEEAKQLGAALFLTKPCSFTELKKNLSLILSRSWNNIETG
jgi:CheY-like chemotaxis protein